MTSLEQDGATRAEEEGGRLVHYHGQELDATTIGDLVRHRRSLGATRFITIEGEEITYEALDEQSDGIAAGLRAAGVAKGDVLATFMYNSIEHLLLWMGAAKLGAIWAPLNVSLIKQDLEYTIKDTGAAAIVVDADLLETYEMARPAVKEALPALVEFVHGDGVAEGMQPATALHHEPVAIDELVLPSDPACITYTGGSTGMPKGVLIPHMLFIATGMRYLAVTDASRGDVHFANGHLFHVGGQQLGVIGPLYCGIESAMTRWFSASKYWGRARAVRATIIDPVGPMLAAIVAQTPPGQDRDHSVRMGIGIGSGQVRRDVRDEFENRFGVELFEVYAQTESGVLMCSETPRNRRPGSCGHPDELGWIEVSIVDDAELPVAAGVEGKIRLRPREPFAFMLEYFRKPEATVAAWRNLWFNTGDLGALDADGYLYFHGREAHWIRRRGENISAFEVEQVVAGHPAVHDCAVVGVPAEIGEEDVKVYVQLEEGAKVEPGDIVAWCTERLSYFKVPRYVEIVDEFPRSVTKKEIERHVLRSRGIGDAWDAGEQGPSRSKQHSNKGD